MRHDDWQPRMWALLEAAKDREFFYGACVQLAAECVDAMTGSAWAKEIAPLYADEAKARELIEHPEDGEAPSAALEALVTQRLGEPVARNWARMGDAVLLELPHGPAIGICTGDRIACAAHPKGVLYLRYERGLKAWRVD